MRTKIILLSTAALLSAGIAMHRARYCPLQHLKSAFAHNHSPAPVKETKMGSLAINK